MNIWLAIAVGGAGGAVSRYWVMTQTAAWFGKGFPYGTLLVNVTGSFVLGFLSIFLVQKLHVPEAMKLAILVGFLGSFTTFSTFSLEVLNAYLAGHSLKALSYIVSSVLTSLLGVYLGYLLAKSFA